ncbi:ABC transporter permease [Oenococcus sp. UCMA 16435]|nr:ABC transporter permease [Oenococcus sp. UCMA 16435]MDI4584615.1 ABC transporter permease [Oenococcus sp. UCMA 14587]
MNNLQLEIKNSSSYHHGFNDALALTNRNLIKMWKSPEKLMDVFIMPIFFMLIFSYLFGGAISGSTKAYLPLVLPGIMIQTLLSISSGTGASIREDINKGVFDRFKSLPILRLSPLIGSLIADLVRYTVATSVTLLVGYIIGWRPTVGFQWVLLAMLFGIGFSWAISWIFVFWGLLAKSAEAVNGISVMIMLGLSFLSNAFVPTSSLPKILQTFVRINPVTHVISALRELLLHGQFGNETLISIIMAAAIVIIFVPLTLWAYNKKI